MTVEASRFVRLATADPEVADLISAIRAAGQRATRALPGDRVDIVRFEALSTRLEALALTRGTDVVFGEAPGDRECGPSVLDSSHIAGLPAPVRDAVAAWLLAGDAVVELVLPFTPGDAPEPTARRSPTATAEPWEAPGGAEGKRAVALRFLQQIDDVLSGRPGAAIMPSGVSNTVLTETLRSYVALSGEPCDAPVRYRDGSGADSFPLRSVTLTGEPAAGMRTLRFALLSIRHTELDVIVDGAWLRNSQVSRPRPAGETDQLVHYLTHQQFDLLCNDAPIHIYLYQTGLDSAIMGFYRALTERLHRFPGSVAVTPMYFRRPPRVRKRRTEAGYEQETFFAEGATWAT